MHRSDRRRTRQADRSVTQFQSGARGNGEREGEGVTNLKMPDAPHSTAPTSEGVPLRFPPPRTDQQATKQRLQSVTLGIQLLLRIGQQRRSRAACTRHANTKKVLQHLCRAVRSCQGGWNGRPMSSATNAHSICCLTQEIKGFAAWLPSKLKFGPCKDSAANGSVDAAPAWDAPIRVWT